MRAIWLVALVACETGGGVDPLVVDGADIVSRDAAQDSSPDVGDVSFDAAIERDADISDTSQFDAQALDVLALDVQAPDVQRPDSQLPDAGDPDAADPDAAPGPSVTVATWNLHCLLDDWPDRLPRFIDTIARLDPDILLLQEVCFDPQTKTDALSEFVFALTQRTGRNYAARRAVTHQAWDRYDEGIAVVSALGIERDQVLDLPSGLFPRKAVVVEVETVLGRWSVGVTHLSFGDQADVRAAQLQAIHAAYPAPLAVLGGDLNQSPDEGPVAEAVGRGYVDAWGTRHPGDNGYTFPASRPRSRIDYLLLGRGLSPLEVRRLGTAPVPSDHLGVAATVQ